MATVVPPAVAAASPASQPQFPFFHSFPHRQALFLSSLPSLFPSSFHLFPAKSRTPQLKPPVFVSASAAQSIFPPQSLNLKSQPLFDSEPFDGCSSSNRVDYEVDGLLNLLRFAVRYGDVELARAVHASIFKLEEDTHLGNILIAAYLKLGLVGDAYSVLMGLSRPNVVSYTALVSGFSKANREDEAVELFFRMRKSGIEPNEYSFVAILSACIRILELELGFQVHALVIKMGYLDCVYVSNALMGLYSKCGLVLQLFDELPQRDLASWNTAISSAVREGMCGKAFELFCDMKQNDGFPVDHFTLSTLLTACAGSNALAEGQEVHALAIKCGLEANLSVSNALIGFYTKCGCVKAVMALFETMPVRDSITWTEMITAYTHFGLMDLALEVFEKMPERNSISCNALLAGFCKNDEGLRALDLFTSMVRERIELTDFTLTSVLNACGLVKDCRISEQIHGFIVKSGCGSNVFIEAALLDMCTKCGRMEVAEKILSQWSFDLDSSIILTSMICGYARNGQVNKAMSLFHLSQSNGTMVVDEVASTSVLGLCGSVGFHETGKQVHCHALKFGFLNDLEVGNALVSMYAKCWNMEDANKVFDSMATRDVVSWNGLIAGHVLHGQGDEALTIWSKMEKTGTKPDKITFTLVISAYRHTNSNLVDNCRSLFSAFKTDYGIEPTSEHYAAFVRVLGYWDQLEEAEEILYKLPFEPEISVWRALLDGCRIHLNTTIGKRVAKRIITMEPKDPSSYILVSNLYSASGIWHSSEIVRDSMRQKGFRKQPAQSWIVHENKIHSFYARDKSHSQAKDIYSGLEILILECQKAGYVPDTSFVLHEVEEHQKKNFLFYHSAKLAATYGLLMTKPGKLVRIVKNIVLCGDCHSFFKYASIVTRREILVRDTSGFHHFSSGQCSCKDYWS